MCVCVCVCLVMCMCGKGGGGGVGGWQTMVSFSVRCNWGGGGE